MYLIYRRFKEHNMHDPHNLQVGRYYRYWLEQKFDYNKIYKTKFRVGNNYIGNLQDVCNFHILKLLFLCNC